MEMFENVYLVGNTMIDTPEKIPLTICIMKN